MPVLDLSAVRSTSSHKPSPQQQAVYDWVRDGSGNLILTAVAGSGKTTTLREACKLMSGRVAFAAYNKRIADEIAVKLAADGIAGYVQAKTFHAFGLAMLRSGSPYLEINNFKVDELLNNFVSQNEDAFRGTLTKLISLGRNHAVDVLWSKADARKWQELIEHYGVPMYADGDEFDLEDTLNIVCEVLEGCKALAPKVVDFDDMIWLPLVLNTPTEKFDWVLVDEAQDTNPARRELAAKMLKASGRAIFVGDPHQAIYGFTGADAQALQTIKQAFNCSELSLSVTYRCPQKVVSFAQNWVSHIQAAPSAPIGSVSTQTLESFRKEALSLRSTDAILCRNTRPLVSLAFELIRAGVSCHVEGRDIGKSLLALTQRWKVTQLRALKEKLVDYRRRELSKLHERKKYREAEALADRIDTVLCIADQCLEESTVWDLRKAIQSLFDDTAEGQKQKRLVLSTVHKAKGREWPTVYLLDRLNLMPSPYAEQDWQLEQENNLIYVAVTRAQEALVELVVGQKEKEVVSL